MNNPYKMVSIRTHGAQYIFLSVLLFTACRLSSKGKGTHIWWLVFHNPQLRA